MTPKDNPTDNLLLASDDNSAYDMIMKGAEVTVSTTDNVVVEPKESTHNERAMAKGSDEKNSKLEGAQSNGKVGSVGDVSRVDKTTYKPVTMSIGRAETSPQIILTTNQDA